MIGSLRCSRFCCSDSKQVRYGFGLAFYWFRIWRELCQPIAERSEAKPKQSITFDTQLKASLYLKATFYVLVSLDRVYAYHLAWVACLDGRWLRLSLRLAHAWACDRAHEEDLGSRQIHRLPRRNSGRSFLHSLYHYPGVYPALLKHQIWIGQG